MTTAADAQEFTVALVGNPNTGKSTLFNALSGMRQRVGNYPGVTVEQKIGHFRIGLRRITLVDLPGTYSLAPRSPDEMVTVDVLLGRQQGERPIDAVIAIVDASNLERNLYLVSQLLDLGLPLVVALNMTDVAAERGITLDHQALAARLGVAVVPIQANRQRGIEALHTALQAAWPRAAVDCFPPAFRDEVDHLARHLDAVSAGNRDARALPRSLVPRLLLDTSGYLNGALGLDTDRAWLDLLAQARARLKAAGCPVPAVEAVSRYRWVSEMIAGIQSRPSQQRRTTSDRIDRVLTHRVWGSLIFALLMIVVFQSVFSWAGPAMDAIDAGVGQIQEGVATLIPPGMLQSLLVDGVIAGVGGVLVFLPQIFILFFFIAVLEDCGYMARAAYLMDKVMSRLGLSGKSFIPLMSSFACAVPGIMAARVIENRRDRLTTVLVAPLMSCSARLPVYTVLIAAFIPNHRYLGGLLGLQGLTLAAMYALGMLTAAVVALVLKRTLLRGVTPPFVMELPAYKAPALGIVMHRMVERGWAFVRRAGTLILAVSILVWAGLYFPHPTESIEGPFAAERTRLEERLAAAQDEAEREADEQALAAIDHEIQGAYERQSILGRMAHGLEPIFRPLGWDWRITCAALASFPAREVVVATLGVIYNLGSELDVGEESDGQKLQTALTQARWDDTGEPVYNVPVALSIMVFFALCAQCAATLMTIKRETNSWRWPVFTFVYMTTLAYLGALATYQIGMRLL